MTMAAEPGLGQRDAKQKTLFDCRKVVKLDASAVCFTAQDIEGIKASLLDPATAKHTLLNALRKLDCYKLVAADIGSTGISHAVAALVKHPQLEVARLAASITDKWQALAGDGSLFTPSPYDYEAAAAAPDGDAEDFFLKAPPTGAEIAAAERAAVAEARRATLRQRLKEEEKMFEGCSGDEEDPIESSSSSEEEAESEDEWQPGRRSRSSSKKSAGKRKTPASSGRASEDDKPSLIKPNSDTKQRRLVWTASGPQLVTAAAAADSADG